MSWTNSRDVLEGAKHGRKTIMLPLAYV